MAIYHFSGKVFSRSKGESAVGKAAYRAGEDLYDVTIDKTFNYAHRNKDVAYKEIMSPDNVPEWSSDRQELWTQVEQKEKRKDAQLAREFNAALPCELSLDKNIELLNQFVLDNFVANGMIADVAIHDANSHNPHAHIMLTMREITAEGFGKKNREWNSKENLSTWRENWGKIINDFLADNGSTERVDHRTLEAQKIDREPTIHMGVQATHMERKGFATRLGAFNRNVLQRNKALMLLKNSMRKVVKSPMELWAMIKDSAQMKAIHPYLEQTALTPDGTEIMGDKLHERLQPPPTHDNEPDIEI